MMNIIEVMTQIVFTYVITDSVLRISNQSTSRIYLLLISFVIVGLYLLRKKSTKFYLLVLGHLLCVAVGYLVLIQLTFHVGIFVVFMILIILSLLLRLVPDFKMLEAPGIFHFVILAILFVVNCYLQNEIAVQTIYRAFLGLILLKILYNNLQQADVFIFNRGTSTKMDTNRLKKVNAGISIIYVTIIGIILFGFSRFNTSNLASTLSAWIKKIFQLLLGLFNQDAMEQAQTMPETEISTMDFGIGTAEKIKEPSMLSKALDTILVTMGCILAVAAVIAIVISTALFVYHYFYEKKEKEGDEKEFIGLFNRNEKMTRPPKKIKNRPFEHDPAKRIRKLYKKNMKGFWGKGKVAPDTLSPSEQLDMVFSMKETLTKEEIIELYEKARYSKNIVAKEEAYKMQELFEKKTMETTNIE